MSGKIQAGALIWHRDPATVISKVFRDYNPWQVCTSTCGARAGRSRSAFVCDFGVTRPARRVAWTIPGLWQSGAQPRLAEAGGGAARMRRARRSRPTLLRVTLADGVAPPACGDRWSTSGIFQPGPAILNMAAFQTQRRARRARPCGFLDLRDLRGAISLLRQGFAGQAERAVFLVRGHIANC